MLVTCSISGVEFTYKEQMFNSSKVHPLCGMSCEDSMTALDFLARNPDKLRTEHDIQNRLGLLRIASMQLGLEYKFLTEHVEFDPVLKSASTAQADPSIQYQIVADATALRSLIRGYDFLGKDFPRLAHLRLGCWVAFLNTCRDRTRELEWDVKVMQERTAGTLFKVYEVASISLGELENYTAKALASYPDAVNLAGRLFKLCINKLHGLQLQDSHIVEADNTTMEGLLSTFTEHWSKEEQIQIAGLIQHLELDPEISIGMRQVLTTIRPWLASLEKKPVLRPKPEKPVHTPARFKPKKPRRLR